MKDYVLEAMSLPPHIAACKLLAYIKKLLSKQYTCLLDQKRSSYSNMHITVDLYRYLSKLNVSMSKKQIEVLCSIADLHHRHCFDLLGSGWVRVQHGMRCMGLQGYRYDMSSPVTADRNGKWLEGRINSVNLSESKQMWSLISQKYIPIDWHLDFKSGYRWSESTHHQKIKYAHQPGVDIKVPWELARMQNLPQLALAYALPKDADSQTFVNEFRNQIIDFIASNPPRFGVNWCCTMDVGIRVVNWLVAYDILSAYSAEFDAAFLTVFRRSVYEHGQYIINNLEDSPTMRSNHYLADIVGLLFVAAYLPCTPETDAWLAFAVQELVASVDHQFHPDGSNFEASASYHRLSAEIVIYATALVLGLPPSKRDALQNCNQKLHRFNHPLQPMPLPFYPIPGSRHQSPFPNWYIQRLEKMAEFVLHITQPDGLIPQIGDNDNGRLLKLSPIYQRLSVREAKARYLNLKDYNGFSEKEDYWNEAHQDHRHLVSAINGLFKRSDFAIFAGENCIEQTIVSQLARHIQLPTNSTRFTVKSISTSVRAYPDFGLYIYSDDNLYLSIRCGTNGQNGNGGHAHNDQLSFELNINGETLVGDPGTFLYTPFAAQRNIFRSTAWHSTVHIRESEQNRWKQNLPGLFALSNDAKARCTCWDNNADGLIFAGECFYGITGIKHIRQIQFNKQKRQIHINDNLHDTQQSRSNLKGFFVLHTPLNSIFSDSHNSLHLGKAKVRTEDGKEWAISDSLTSPNYGATQLSKRAVVNFIDKISVTIILPE
jgi:uncharacterized heparinase superfamily protein